MVMTRSNFVDLLDPSFRKIFDEEYKRRPEYYSKLFHIENSTRQSEKLSQVTTLGLFAEKAEGSSISYDAIKQGYDVEAVHVTYALGFRVTREALDDDQFSILKQKPKALALSAKETVEVLSWSLINNGFNSAYTFGDGKELFATDHPSPHGITGRNELSTAADLSATSLRQAIQDIESTTCERGLPLALRADVLMVPPALEWTAKELLKSSQDPESANNTINPLYNRGLSLFVNPYLTDDDAWFLVDSTQHKLFFFWRKQLEMNSDYDYNTGDALYSAYMRFSRTAGDWRGIFGSPGA